jgi:aspartyl-tRNA(Asn)/glutamyl-tRNA(Gln) amidotransferase subunit A
VDFRIQIIVLARAGRSVERLAREFEPCAATIWISSDPAGRAVRKLRSEVSVSLGPWDVIVTPSAAAQHGPAADAVSPVIDGVEVRPRGHAVHTGPVNACGHPTLTVPAAPVADGMPTWVQIIGDLSAEKMPFDLLERYDAAGPGCRWPTLLAM